MSYYRIRKAFTSTVLNASAAYTSESIHVNQFDRLTGIAFSDQSGSLDIEQSIDGTNWDFKTTVAVTGATGKEFDVKVYGEWARLKYTNGATNQNTFRLAVYATPMG